MTVFISCKYKLGMYLSAKVIEKAERQKNIPNKQSLELALSLYSHKPGNYRALISIPLVKCVCVFHARILTRTSLWQWLYTSNSWRKFQISQIYFRGTQKTNASFTKIQINLSAELLTFAAEMCTIVRKSGSKCKTPAKEILSSNSSKNTFWANLRILLLVNLRNFPIIPFC